MLLLLSLLYMNQIKIILHMMIMVIFQSLAQNPMLIQVLSNHLDQLAGDPPWYHARQRSLPPSVPRPYHGEGDTP
jgi:hypothetical protein